MRQTVAERFWSKVNIGRPDECWEWQRSRFSFGHGRFRLGKKIVGAHRVAYELAFGPIPEGLDILHGCDNPPCCNPAHLHTGTQADNTREAVERTAMNCGERNGQAKLTSDQVLTIRKIYDAGGVFQRELAERFGVTQTAISVITRRKWWRHLSVGQSPSIVGGVPDAK
jgi:predicted XRE-type DNA-binding protein